MKPAFSERIDLDAAQTSLMEAGQDTALHLKPSRHERFDVKARIRRFAEVKKLLEERRKATDSDDSAWISDNLRLLATAHKQAKVALLDAEGYSLVEQDSGDQLLRPEAVATRYLRAVEWHYDEGCLQAYLQGFQQHQELPMRELWALKPMLQAAILERLADTSPDGPPTSVLVESLRRLGEADWADLFEHASLTEAILRDDPAAIYAKMDRDSRDQYRRVLAHVAKRSGKPESSVASLAVSLAAEAQRDLSEDQERVRRHHVGYWLIDEGAARLREESGFVPAFDDSVEQWLYRNSTAFFLSGIALATLVLLFVFLSQIGDYTPAVVGLVVLILAITQGAVDFINQLVSYLLPPRVLPKLDLKDGIPPEFATLVAVPTLLVSTEQVRETVAELEVRFLANRDPNLYFSLLTDATDALEHSNEETESLALCVQLVEGLNERYREGDRTPFFLFHRHRIFNPVEGRWMGWERKRGKLLDLNQLLRGGFDSFPVKVGDLTVLPDIRYVITLDSDTQLPRDAARKLIGTIAHPLNRAVVDRATNTVRRGYGILQPRIGISIQSASRSRLASLYSGQTGFDIYTRAVSDVYQDLFGEGIFTGKGIYDVDAFRATLEHRFPENALLSHDLIEGAYARVALVSDLELIDDYPSHFSAYSRRKHRWVRGDWQTLRWLLPRVPDFHGNIIPNPIRLISRWKILDNLRRSVFEPSALALLLWGWTMEQRPGAWTLLGVGLFLLPVLANLLFSLLRAPWSTRGWGLWGKNTAENLVLGAAHAAIQITFLLHQALLALDAITRSVVRVFVTRRKLLEWETAAQAESAQRRRATVDIYLSWSPVLTLLIVAAVVFSNPGAIPYAAPILLAWLAAPALSAYLNRPPKRVRRGLTEEEVTFLRRNALYIWRYFAEWSAREESNHLIPDFVLASGVAAQRLSPTNLGFLLNARLAALHLGYTTVSEFARDTQATLNVVKRLPKHNGHLLNWYDNATLAILEPRFVSSVDSGNLAAALWTLAQASRALEAGRYPDTTALQRGLADLQTACEQDPDPWWQQELVTRQQAIAHWESAGLTPDLRTELKHIAIECEHLVRDMDFASLYHPKRKLLSVGYDLDARTLSASSYDLLASESRIGCFVAIAKGDIPQEAWFHLGRRHVIAWGQKVLLSWTGTMFEYLMPNLWMRHYSNTLLCNAIESAVRAQQQYAAERSIPWGISESACINPIGGDHVYAPFGLPQLAMKPTRGPKVVSPYSSMLALPIEPEASLQNLHRMLERGWWGRYGFPEAIDFTNNTPEVVDSWMAHHQGMSLLAVTNLLFDNVMQDYFHSEPHVIATELLLHERVPALAQDELEAEEQPEFAAADQQAQ